MASESHRDPPEDTILLDDDERAARAEDWPVADLYVVGAEEAPPDDGDATRVFAQHQAPVPPRRLPPDVGTALVAIAAAVALAALILGAALLASRADGQDSRTTAGATTTPVPAATRPAESTPRPKVTPPASRKPTTSKSSLAAEVPSVVGLPASNAVAALRRAGFVVRIGLVPSTGSKAGLVLTQSPPGAAEAASGTTVRLEVSKARPAPPQVAVPDLVGIDVGEARQRLESAGLTAGVVRISSSQPVGTVLRQSPREGARVQEKGRVTLTVSSGPETVDVPEVVGLDEESARAELEGAGFEVEVTFEPTSDPAQDGVVVGQTPAGASTAVDGSVVTIAVAQLG